MKKRKHPTAKQFALLMEAWASAYSLKPEDRNWSLIFRLAHCVTGAKCQKSHPKWIDEFWKKYDEVKSYWGGQ